MENNRGLFIDQLDKVGPGHYRSTPPVPVWGSWKTLLRVHDGYTMTAVPIYLPGDHAIRHPRFPRRPMTRPFVPEITILQRERDQNAPAWLFTAGLDPGALLHADRDRRADVGRGPAQQRRQGARSR